MNDLQAIPRMPGRSAAETTADRRPDDAFLSLRDSLSEEQQIELLELWRSVTSRKWAILLFGFACALLAAAIAFALPPIYRATASVLIEAEKSKVLKIDEVYEGAQGREHFNTQVEVLKSRDLALKTIEALKLYDLPEFDPRLAQTGWWPQFKRSVRTVVGMAEPTIDWSADSLAPAVLGGFESRLSIDPVRNSQLIRISFESESASLAARVAAAVARIYIDSDRQARLKLTEEATSWLTSQASDLQDKLATSERALQDFRDRQGLVNIGGSAQAFDTQQITTLSQRLIDARVATAQRRSVYDDLVRMRNRQPADYTSVAEVMRHPSVISAKAQESAALQKLSELSQRYGYEHPRIVQATAEVEAARTQTVTESGSVASSLIRDYENARATEQSLNAALNTVRGSVQVVNRKEAELGALEREVAANRQVYELFMGRAKETSAAVDLQSQIARVVDAPLINSGPVRPKKGQIVAIALLLGLLAGAGLAILIDRLDNSVKGPSDAEARLHHPVLASVPLLLGEQSRQPARLLTEQPDTAFAEAVRTARTGVLLSGIDTPRKIILVTSSVPGEGKSVVATNLAAALSANKTTLLIDADMRRPTVARELNLAAGIKGLSNLIAGTAELGACVHAVKGSRVHVLPAGDIPPNSSELLLSTRFKDLLARLSKIYEVLVIDSPPVELVSDALIIAPMATGTIYVVKAMSTPCQLARNGLTRIQRSGGTVLGVVLNQVDFEKAQRRYGQYAAYGTYGYGSYGYKAAKTEPVGA